MQFEYEIKVQLFINNLVAPVVILYTYYFLLASHWTFTLSRPSWSRFYTSFIESYRFYKKQSNTFDFLHWKVPFENFDVILIVTHFDFLLIYIRKYWNFALKSCITSALLYLLSYHNLTALKLQVPTLVISTLVQINIITKRNLCQWPNLQKLLLDNSDNVNIIDTTSIHFTSLWM